MFPPLPLRLKRSIGFGLAVIAIGVAAALTASYLQRGEIEIASAAAAFLGTLLAVTQWLVAQFRETARTSWEAVKTYYADGDSDILRNARRSIFDGTTGAEDVFCNFYEKWGRLVEMGYLPIEIFNGPSGVSISNAAIKLEPFLTERRGKNEKYAQSYLRLIRQIHANGLLIGTIAQAEAPKMLDRLSAG